MDLDRLVGTWALTMNHSEMPEPQRGIQTYKRILDDAFLMLAWHYENPDLPDALALIDDHTYDYFDVRGVVRHFDFQLGDDGWTLTWIDPEFSQRQTAVFKTDDLIEIEGERSTDRGATWAHDFTTTLERQR